MDWVTGRSLVPQVEVVVGGSAVMLSTMGVEVNGMISNSNVEYTFEVCDHECRIGCCLIEVFSCVVDGHNIVACEFDYWIGDDCDIVNISQFSIIKSCEFHIEIWD